MSVGEMSENTYPTCYEYLCPMRKMDTLKSNCQCDGIRWGSSFGKWLGHKSGTLLTGLCRLSVKDVPGNCPASSTMWGHDGEGIVCETASRSSPDTVYSLWLWASRPAELWEICCCWLTGMLVASCYGSCINVLRQHHDSFFSSFPQWIVSRPGAWSWAAGKFLSTLARWWSQSNTWRLLVHRSFYHLPCCLINDHLVIDSICHSFLW